MAGVGGPWFIGAPLGFSPEDEALVPDDADVRPTRAGDRHVTLMFLGRVTEDTARRVWAALPRQQLPDEVRALRWNRFGRSALALELTDDDGLLQAAAAACRHATSGLVDARAPERFRPHVTMARVPRRGRPPSSRALAAWPLPTQPLRLGPLTLFVSNVQPAGDRYEAVERRG